MGRKQVRRGGGMPPPESPVSGKGNLGGKHDVSKDGSGTTVEIKVPPPSSPITRSFKVSTSLASLGKMPSKIFRAITSFFGNTFTTATVESEKIMIEEVKAETTLKKEEKSVNTIDDLSLMAENDYIKYQHRNEKELSRKADDSLPGTFTATLQLKEKFEKDFFSAKSPVEKEASIKNLISVSIIEWACLENVIEKYGASLATVEYILDETRDHRADVTSYIADKLRFIVDDKHLSEKEFIELVHKQVNDFSKTEETKGFVKDETRRLKPGDRSLDFGRG